MWWLKTWQKKHSIFVCFGLFLRGCCLADVLGQARSPSVCVKKKRKAEWKLPSLCWALVRTLSWLYPKHLQWKWPWNSCQRQTQLVEIKTQRRKQIPWRKEKCSGTFRGAGGTPQHMIVMQTEYTFTSITTHILTDAPLRMLPMEDDQWQAELSQESTATGAQQR